MSEIADQPHARRAARAIDALRRGWPFRVTGADGALDLLAVEPPGESRAQIHPEGFG